MAHPGDLVPQNVSIEVNGKTHTGSYVAKDGWVEVTSDDDGTSKGTALYDMPTTAADRKTVESIARALLGELLDKH